MSLHDNFDIDTLVRQNLPLARSVAMRVAAQFPRHADREELAQAAALGLVEAAHRYDPSQGVPFPAWAAQRMRGAVLDAVRRLDVATRSVRSTARLVEQAEEQLTNNLGRTPLLDEVSAVTGISVTELRQLQADLHAAVLLSLDMPVTDSNGIEQPLSATIIDTVDTDPCGVLEHREQMSYLRTAMDLLPDRLRDVVVSYYLEGEASTETAARLGVTESRVSQMRSQALGLLREGLEAQYADRESASAAGAAVKAPGVAAARRAAYAAAVSAHSSFANRLSGIPPQRQPQSSYEPMAMHVAR